MPSNTDLNHQSRFHELSKNLIHIWGTLQSHELALMPKGLAFDAQGCRDECRGVRMGAIPSQVGANSRQHQPFPKPLRSQASISILQEAPRRKEKGQRRQRQKATQIQEIQDWSPYLPRWLVCCTNLTQAQKASSNYDFHFPS